MSDLTEFTGDQALRNSLVKKRDKAEAKRIDMITKAQAKIAPVEAEIAQYDELIAVIDRRSPPKLPEAPQTEEKTEPNTVPAHWKDEEKGANDLSGVTDQQ